MASIGPAVQCIWKHGVVAIVLWTPSSKKVNFIILLLQLGLAGFSRVSTVNRLRVSFRIMVRFSFSDRVGIALPNME